MSVDAIVDTVKRNLGEMRHVVITGGEPMLQPAGLYELCKKLKTIEGLHITLETNGTHFDQNIAALVDLFSISAKLRNAVRGWKDKKAEEKCVGDCRIKVIQQYISFCAVSSSDFHLTN